MQPSTIPPQLDWPLSGHHLAHTAVIITAMPIVAVAQPALPRLLTQPTTSLQGRDRVPALPTSGQPCREVGKSQLGCCHDWCSNDDSRRNHAATTK